MGVVLNIFDVMEMIGIISFAISGAMVGIRKQLDFFGVLILGIVTAVGGGVLRDVIIGVTPPVMFRNPSYTVVASITAAIFFASRIRKRLYRRHRLFDLAMFVTDTIGMAIFVVNGIQGAMNSLEWYNPFLLAFVGVTTGAGGGIIRDIMVGTVPRVLRKQIYFTAALAGAVYYIVLLPYLPEFWDMLLAVAVICVIRGLAFHYRWNLPRAKQAEFDE